MFQLGLLTPLLLFVAFLLLLLISLSVPIIKTIFLFRLTAKASSSLLHSSAEAYVNFGAFGYCTSGLDATYVSSTLDAATILMAGLAFWVLIATRRESAHERTPDIHSTIQWQRHCKISFTTQLCSHLTTTAGMSVGLKTLSQRASPLSL